MKKAVYSIILALLFTTGAVAQLPVKGIVLVSSSEPTAGTVTLPSVDTEPGEGFTIPVTVANTTGLNIIAYQFDLVYDPTVIQPQESAVETGGTLSSNLSAVYNPNTPGLLKVAVYGAYPLTGSGTLIKLKFKAVGAIGSGSSLRWVNFMFNEGNPRANPVNGEIRVVSSPLQVNFSGRQDNPGTFDFLNSIFRSNTFAMVSDDHDNATSMTLSVDLIQGDGAWTYQVVSSDWTVMVYENGAYAGSMYGEVAEGRAVDQVDSVTGAVLKRTITTTLRIKGGMGRFENVLPQEKGAFTSVTTYGNDSRTTAVLKRLL